MTEPLKQQRFGAWIVMREFHYEGDQLAGVFMDEGRAKDFASRCKAAGVGDEVSCEFYEDGYNGLPDFWQKEMADD